MISDNCSFSVLSCVECAAVLTHKQFFLLRALMNQVLIARRVFLAAIASSVFMFPAGAGATIAAEPQDQDHGDRMYLAVDPEGHRWMFSMPLKGSA